MGRVLDENIATNEARIRGDIDLEEAKRQTQESKRDGYERIIGAGVFTLVLDDDHQADLVATARGYFKNGSFFITFSVVFRTNGVEVPFDDGTYTIVNPPHLIEIREAEAEKTVVDPEGFLPTTFLKEDTLEALRQAFKVYANSLIGFD